MAEVPNPETFFLEVPLYASFDFDSSNFESVLLVEEFRGTLDTYCGGCGRESVFQVALPDPGIPPTSPPRTAALYVLAEPPNPEEVAAWKASETKKRQAHAIEDRIFLLQFRCTRDERHTMYFLFRVQDSTITKVGQHPSLADLRSMEIKKYRKILDDSDYRELNRAIGLYAHGVGIGAFVYLRRILERLIDEAHVRATKRANWDEESFEKSRIAERILMLTDFLPAFMVENRAIYVILSKGIHELTEEECLKHFEILRVSIELVLDEKIEAKERERKIAQTKKALGTVLSKL